LGEEYRPVNKLVVAFVIMTLTLVIIAPPLQADEWNIIRDERGDTRAVTNGVPGTGWSVAEGPFSSLDAALRASGTGPNFQGIYHKKPQNFPPVRPGKSGENTTVLLP
jgi:hypothetical protein